MWMIKATVRADKGFITIPIPDSYQESELEVLIYTKGELLEKYGNHEADNLNFAVPEWQKEMVRKSIRKYEENPQLLIAEEDAWKLLDKE